MGVYLERGVRKRGEIILVNKHMTFIVYKNAEPSRSAQH